MPLLANVPMGPRWTATLHSHVVRGLEHGYKHTGMFVPMGSPCHTKLRSNASSPCCLQFWRHSLGSSGLSGLGLSPGTGLHLVFCALLFPRLPKRCATAVDTASRKSSQQLQGIPQGIPRTRKNDQKSQKTFFPNLLGFCWECGFCQRRAILPERPPQ